MEAVEVASAPETVEVAAAPSKKRKDIAIETPAKKAAVETPAKKAKLDDATPPKPSLPIHEGAAKPNMSHEKSRFQFLCRTGVKGQPSQKFRYQMPNGDAGEYANEAEAKKAAQAWVKARTPKCKLK